MMNFKYLMGISILALSFQIKAQAHEMQHGFILSNNDTIGSHLVASGHHSRQTEVLGELTIQDKNELAFYQQRKRSSGVNQTYFLFQAQQLNLPSLAEGTVLAGHIIESKMGGYEPKRIIVRYASFRIQKILLNIPNPFFATETMIQKKHCCDTGKKPCNWKC